MMSDKVDLVSKLLAKAESTTPEEAEALREAAMKLMVRHGITEAMLQSTGKAAREDIVCRDVWINSCYASEFRDMAFRVTRAMGSLKMLYGGSGDHLLVSFYGHESDADRMHMLFRSLMTQSLTAMKAWWRIHSRLVPPGTPHYDRHLERAEYLRGFTAGVVAQINSAKAETILETGPGTDIVLADRTAAVAQWVDENLNIRTINFVGSRGGSYDASQDGYSDGKNANLHNRKELSSGNG